jgi:Tfp pilus assembly protein PilO
MSPKLFNLLLAASSFALYYVVIGPLYSGIGSVWQPEQGITQLEQTNIDYGNTLSQADSLVKQATTLRTQYNSIPETTKQNMKLMVPDSVDPVRLVSELTNLGIQTGIPIDTITYAPGQNTSDTYGSYRVSFTVKTSYPRFKELMHNIETSLRLLSVQNVTFTLPDKDTKLTSFQVALETYYMK